MEISKEGREKKIYRRYRSFNTEPLRETLSDKLSGLDSNSYSEFKNVLLPVPNNQDPLKTKFLRHNSNPFMTKELRKATMKKSELKNKYNKNKNHENWYLYKKQRYFCVRKSGFF